MDNVYGRFASFFKNYELKEADKYIKRVFPNAEFYLDYEHALVFERIGEDKEIDLDYHTVINGAAYDGTFTSNYNELVKYFDESKVQEKKCTEMIKDMLERQKAYDEEVFKKHNVDYVSKTQLESALFDELGELMHAQKSDWCWWKFTQEPKDEAKVFEEYIDVVHFALMYEIKFGTGCYMDEDVKWNYNKLKTDLGFGQAYAFSCVISLTRDDNVLAYVIALGLHLGYSFGEIYNEYIRKNEINKERLVKGY